MADRRIVDLDEATVLTNNDLFVLSQSNQAKKTTWSRILTYLANALDGHGGINNIAKVSTSENVDTYRITYADATSSTFEVANGKEIASVVQYFAVSTSNSTVPVSWYTSRQTMNSTIKYLWSYYQFNYNDGTSDNTVPSVIGVYGDTGNDWHVHIRYAAQNPTADADMRTTPSNWIGIYSGTMSEAPTSYTSYSWFQYKGEKGDTGNAIVSINRSGTSGLVDTYTITFSNNTTSTFQVRNGSNITGIAKTGTSGLIDTYTVTLSDGTTTTFNVTNAKSITSIVPVSVTHASGASDTYRINFNDGDTFEFSVYNGANGTGSVSTVDGITSANQDVPLMAFGSGAPTTATVGSLKSRYFDTASSRLYICTGIDTSGAETTYTWAGAGVTTDSTMSTTSTNPVQNAVLTAIIGTIAMNTTAQTLKGAVNELKAAIDTVSGNVSSLRASNIPMQDNQSVQSHVDTLETDVGTLQSGLSDAQGDISDLDSAVDNLAKTVGNVTLFSASWTGSGPWEQEVVLNGVTVTGNTKVDLQADATALEQLQNADASAVYAVNSNGTITVYLRGKAALKQNITLQYTIYEVNKVGNISIIGSVVTSGGTNFYEVTQSDFTLNTSVLDDDEGNGYCNGIVSNGWVMLSLSLWASAKLTKGTNYKILDVSSGLVAVIGHTYRQFTQALSNGTIIEITVNTWGDNSEIDIQPLGDLAVGTGVGYNIVLPCSYNA